MSSEGSEWMKIMLEEIARKKAEEAGALAEEVMRAEEQRSGAPLNTRSK
jgi:hypothetical protein